MNSDSPSLRLSAAVQLVRLGDTSVVTELWEDWNHHAFQNTAPEFGGSDPNYLGDLTELLLASGPE